MKLFLFTFLTGIGQMILLEEHLWGTKDWNKNIIGASFTSSIWKIISKTIS